MVIKDGRSLVGVYVGGSMERQTGRALNRTSGVKEGWSLSLTGGSTVVTSSSGRISHLFFEHTVLMILIMLGLGAIQKLFMIKI